MENIQKPVDETPRKTGGEGRRRAVHNMQGCSWSGPKQAHQGVDQAAKGAAGGRLRCRLCLRRLLRGRLLRGRLRLCRLRLLRLLRRRCRLCGCGLLGCILRLPGRLLRLLLLLIRLPLLLL